MPRRRTPGSQVGASDGRAPRKSEREDREDSNAATVAVTESEFGGTGRDGAATAAIRWFMLLRQGRNWSPCRLRMWIVR